jgi:DNA-binding NtrC family response regulator
MGSMYGHPAFRPAPATVATSPTIQVLVVEPEEVVKQRLARTLTGEGFSVTLVQNLDELVERCGERVFDVALVDMDASPADPVSLVRRVRDGLPTAKILMMTDYGDDDLWLSVMDAGASDLIEKPVMRQQLERYL